MAATRWGIISAGNICSDFSAAIRSLPKDEHEIIAVAARSLERAKKFAKTFDIPNAHDSYEDVAKNPDIDVVYIGTVNSEHYKMCLLMLDSGKHVLCEKPMCLNPSDTRDLFRVAREKGLFIAEGFWSRHFPVYKKLKEELKAGVIGDIKMMDAKFGFRKQDDARISSKELGGGALYDMGVYPLQFAVMVFGRKPEKIVASGALSPEGVDTCVFANLHYSDGCVARLVCHSEADMDQQATIYGTDGRITIPNFWSPSNFQTPQQNFDLPLPKIDHSFNYINSEGLVYEIQAVRESLLKGELEHPLVSAADSIAISEITEECLRQVGYGRSSCE